MRLAQDAPHKRLDELVQPGWASMAEAALRYGGLLLGLLLLWLGFITGGFFLALATVLAAVSIVGGWLLAAFVAKESWYSRSDARPLTLLIVVGFPLTLVAIAQIAAPLLVGPPVRELHVAGSLAADSDRTEALAVDPRIETMRLDLNITSMTGTAVRWYLVNPSGESRWSGRAGTTGLQQSRVIDASGGRWELHMVSEAGTAEYVVDWTGWDASGPVSRAP